MGASEPVKHSGWDLVGAGKVAEAIPPEVYKQSTVTVCKTFESLVAPLTQTTDGLGRLIRQTFDNWVEVRKAIGTYTLQQAVIRAKARTEKQRGIPQPPSHPKTFIRALEESSLETDSIVHEMWVNLLASQIVDQNSHPRFVGILTELGPDEVKLLLSLKPYPKNDSRLSSYVGGSMAHTHFSEKMTWVTALDQPAPQPWNLSATLLCQHSLAEASPRSQSAGGGFILLHLTLFGEAFLAAVAPTLP